MASVIGGFYHDGNLGFAMPPAMEHPGGACHRRYRNFHGNYLSRRADFGT